MVYQRKISYRPALKRAFIAGLHLDYKVQKRCPTHDEEKEDLERKCFLIQPKMTKFTFFVT